MTYEGENLGVPIHVFGPETHMTAIVGMALGKRSIIPAPQRANTTANFLLPGGQVRTISILVGSICGIEIKYIQLVYK